LFIAPLPIITLYKSKAAAGAVCCWQLLSESPVDEKGGAGKLLKVPKREIFVTELFILSDPIWIGGLLED
jgi:hypothetical protein